MKKIYLPLLIILINFQFCSSPRLDNPIVLLYSPTGINSAEPNLVEGDDGHLYLSWIEKNDKIATLLYSKWENNSWSDPNKIASGNDWFVNWADYPAIAINKNGDMIAHYLQKSDSGTFTYDIKIVTKKSTDKTWSLPVKLHSDTVRAEHGFVSMRPFKNGDFFISWLDGRKMSGNESHDAHGNGAMTLRGATINVNGVIKNDTELDGRVCDCCQTSTAVINNNPAVLYRDRSEGEIRDMSLVKFKNGTWNKPMNVYADNWEIAGCPVNGPKIIEKNGVIAIAWFSAPKNIPQVKLAFSSDGGETFGEPIIVDDSQPLGRVDAVILHNGEVLVSWLDMVGTEAIIKVALFNDTGLINEAKSVTVTKESRSSGFPQMEIHNDTLFFAWTDVQKNTEVKTANLIFQ